MAEIGSVIDGKYEILREIGHGGMSVVYLAMDTHLNKQWAVKEIKKKGSGKNDEIIVNSLLAEANLMKRLDHAALPRIVDLSLIHISWTDVLKRPCRNDRAAPPRAAARKARWTGVPSLREYAVLTDTDNFRPAAYVHHDSPREEARPAPLTSPQYGRHKFPDPS